MRGVTLAILVTVHAVALAQPPEPAAWAPLRALAAAGTAPVFAEPPSTPSSGQAVAAIVQLTAHSAALAMSAEVAPGVFGIVARSRPFALARPSNFGSWLEEFRFTAPDRLTLSFTARGGCANRSITHRFVLRDGVWLVAGLDEAAMRCTGRGVEQDWLESSNYLSRQAVRTTYHPSQPPKTTQGRTPRRAFPLSAFPPAGPERVYAEMQ